MRYFIASLVCLDFEPAVAKQTGQIFKEVAVDADRFGDPHEHLWQTRFGFALLVRGRAKQEPLEHA